MPRRYHHGMVRQCPRGHDGIKPGEVADDMSAYHLTRQAPDLTEDWAKQLEIELEVAMAELQSFGGEGDERVRGQSTRSRGQAGAPSLNLSIGNHLSGGLWRSSSESSVARRCSRQSEREEEDASERGGCDRSGWPRPPGRVRPGRLAPIGGPGPTGGPGLAGREREREGFNHILKQKLE
jgi:hypothetical protein